MKAIAESYSRTDSVTIFFREIAGTHSGVHEHLPSI